MAVLLSHIARGARRGASQLAVRQMAAMAAVSTNLQEEIVSQTRYLAPVTLGMLPHVPLIAVGLSPLDHQFKMQLQETAANIGSDVDVVLMRDYMDDADLFGLPPRHITDAARGLLKGVNGLVMPGTPNTVPEFMRKRDVSLFPKVDVRSAARWTFKMAQTAHAITKGIPLITSCEATSVLTLLKGGNLYTYEELKEAGIVGEDGTLPYHPKTEHQMFIPQFSEKRKQWLYKLAEGIEGIEVLPNGTLKVNNVPSTHPLTPVDLPEGDVEVLARAPDGTASIYQLPDVLAIAVIDHPEARRFGPPLGERAAVMDDDDVDNVVSRTLWGHIAKTFIRASELHMERPPYLLQQTKLDPWCVGFLNSTNPVEDPSLRR